MSYRSQSLHQLIEDCNRTLFLPHIQRPFVWKEDQMVRLLDSLMRGYPIQTFLLWKTREFIKARRFMGDVTREVDLHTLYDQAKSEEGVEKTFVLDGQQRLQTLFTFFNGAIVEDGKRREAWIDLLSGIEPDEDGLFYRIKFAKSSPGDSWYRICDLRSKHAKKNAEDIADGIIDMLEAERSWSAKETKENGKIIRRNVAQLVSLLRNADHFWHEELDGTAYDFPYQRVLDIFVRVNSGGTKLDGSDLMFAAMKGLSDDVEEQVEDVAEMLNQGDLSFDKGWVLKCLVVANGGGAEVGPKLFQGKPGEALMAKIEGDWQRAVDAFQQLKDLLTHDLRLYSEKIIKSYVSILPIFDYLFYNPKPDPTDRRLIVGYFYKAQLFNWYGASTDKIIAALHKLVGRPLRGGFPLAAIKKHFEDAGRDTELDADNIGEARVRLIVLNLVYQEMFGASAFATHFPGNQPHVDHIYPRSMLRKRLELESWEINHLGNFRFVGATDNIRKRAQLPDSYFSDLKANKVPVEKHLLVEPYAQNPSKLTFNATTYRKFRDARFQALLDLARKVVDPEVE
ncbi:MAG: DUF262 domain-containing protein [Myxococcota bacterium]